MVPREREFMLPLTHDILRCHAPLPASAKASARRRNQGRAGALAEAASGASSIPETVVLEPKSRGVLDRPVKPDDDGRGMLVRRSLAKAASRAMAAEKRGHGRCSPWPELGRG